MFKKRKIFVLGVFIIIMLFAVNAAATELPDITGHWAEDDVRELVEMGAITGYPDGTYRPEGTITRAEFSSVLRGALGLGEAEGTTFPDTAGHWGQGRIEALIQEGIIDTDLYGQYYRPDGSITREEIAMMTVRMLGDLTGSIDIPFLDADKVGAGFTQYVAEAYARGIITGYPDDTFRPKGTATRAEAAVMAIRALRILSIPEEDVPTIVSFSADTDSIMVGAAATLSWEVSGATTITIDPDISSVTAHGSMEVTPSSSTTYTLTATNNAGSSTAQVTIEVTPFFIPPKPNGFILPPPSIASFSTDKSIMTKMQTARLSWEVNWAATVNIDQGIGEVDPSGSLSVMPAETTTYTLTATNASGSTTETTTITVEPIMVIQPGRDEGLDAYVSSFEKNKNYAYDTKLRIGRSVHSSGVVLNRGLIRFDLSELPNDAVIFSATLLLYQYDSIKSLFIDPEEATISAHNITSTLDLFTATWNNQPQHDLAAESTLTTEYGTKGWRIWDIKNLVQGWVDGSINNHGVLLKGDEHLDVNQSVFRSSNYTSDPELRPQLRIHYYIP